jgi:DNA-binding NarL/FixJ family response regulator
MMNNSSGKPVLICDSQPVTMEGVRGVLNATDDLRFAGGVCSLDVALELTGALRPAAVILDKSLGTNALLDFLRESASQGIGAVPVVWGALMNESEALRLLQAGARGVLRRTADGDTLLSCLRSVISGNTFMESGIFGDTRKLLEPRRSELTIREREVATLVQQGMRNRDIARTLGIQPGTVKIHLKHIFEKTGVRGRYGLALTNLREIGAVPLPTM